MSELSAERTRLAQLWEGICERQGVRVAEWQRRTDPVIGEFETVRQRHRMLEAGEDVDVWRAALADQQPEIVRETPQALAALVHFAMSDLTNRRIANLLSKWLHDHALDAQQSSQLIGKTEPSHQPLR